MQRAVEVGLVHDGEFAQILNALAHGLALEAGGKELEIGDIFAQRGAGLAAFFKDLGQAELRFGGDFPLTRCQFAIERDGLFVIAGRAIEFGQVGADGVGSRVGFLQIAAIPSD